MHKTTVFRSKWGIAAGLSLFLISGAGQALFGQSFDIPNKKWGLSFGNSSEFTGLRFNFRDSRVRHIRGVNITLGGEFLKGIQLAGGMVHVVKGGQMVGFAASPFNYFRGSQNGLAIGIVNYAFRVKGVQIGLVNIIRDNPKYLKVLPIMNTSF